MAFRNLAQVSMEFLLIVLFALAVIVPILIYFISESRSNVSEVNAAKVGQIARKLSEVAETVYAFGEPTTFTVTVYMPEGVESVYLNGTRLSFVVQIDGDSRTISHGLPMNLTGTIKSHAGVHRIGVRAANNSIVFFENSG